MSGAQEAFGARLKAEREKKGIPLSTIAESTKVSASFFKGLEASDLSRWPKGIFRRSYLRDYLTAVGLPVQGTLEEFARRYKPGT